MRRLLVLLLLLPLATAQTPGQASLDISTADDTIIVTREESRTFTVSATFESDNPFDGIDGRTIRLVETAAVPEDWLVDIDPPQYEDVLAGETKTFTLTVSLSAGADESEVLYGLQAILVPRNQEDNPITGQVDPEVESNQLSLTLKREDPLTREVLEGVGPLVWVALGGLALLAVILAVVLSRGNKAAVAMRSAVTVADVAPGRSVAVPITVENLTGNENTVVFHVAPVSEGWAASLPLPELALDGRRKEELHLVVTAPGDARPGDTQRVGISAHSTQNPNKVAELLVDVHVGDTPERKSAGDTTPKDQQ